MTDETQETPETPEASEVSEASEASETEVAEATEPTQVAEPIEAAAPEEPAPTGRDRSYVRVPTWAAAVIGVIVLAGGGFVLGRATAPDDDRVDVRAADVPTPSEIPDFRQIDPNEVPRPVARAFFGVTVEEAANGVAVIRVSSGSPAEEAGFRDGDVITEVDGKEVTTAQELADAIRAHEPGDEVTITYTRDGGSTEAKVRLDDRFAEDSPSN
jgi:membrane-associated protease RseP (regulator of RpoE activity)